MSDQCGRMAPITYARLLDICICILLFLVYFKVIHLLNTCLSNIYNVLVLWKWGRYNSEQHDPCFVGIYNLVMMKDKNKVTTNKPILIVGKDDILYISVTPSS